MNEVLEGTEADERSPEAAGRFELETDDSYAMYDQARLPVFKITLGPAAQERLNFEPREYVPVVMELVDGEHSERLEVGLKLKGQGSFRNLDGKAALRLKIDKYVKGQTLSGLRDLTLNNMVQDRSLMAERLAYVAFRELGVPAPRANHAMVYINDVYFGLYANIETPNEDFLAHWFQDPSRNLYEQQGRDFDHPEGAASFELETNEDQPDARENLHALQDACIARDLDRARELVDWHKFLLFAALEAAVNQVDGYSYAQLFPNNFRIYDSASGIVFIPWGLDWALGPVATQDGGLFVDPLWVRPTHGVLMRMCLADANCALEYMEVVKMVASRWDDLLLEDHMDRWAAQIDEAFQADDRREASVDLALVAREERREIIRGRAQKLLEAVEPAGSLL